MAKNNLEMIEATKKWMSFVFEIKDVDEIRYVLSVETVINHSKKLLCYARQRTLKKVLEYFQTLNSKPIGTLIEKGLTLSLE